MTKVLDIAFSTILSPYTQQLLGKQLFDYPIYSKFYMFQRSRDTVELMDLWKFAEEKIEELKPEVVNFFFGDYLVMASFDYFEIAAEFASTLSCKKVLTTYPIVFPIEDVRFLSDMFPRVAALNIINGSKLLENFDLLNFVYFSNKLHFAFLLVNIDSFCEHEIAVSRVASKKEYNNVLTEMYMLKLQYDVAMNVVPIDAPSYYFYKFKLQKMRISVEPKKRVSLFPKRLLFSYDLFPV